MPALGIGTSPAYNCDMHFLAVSLWVGRLSYGWLPISLLPGADVYDCYSLGFPGARSAHMHTVLKGTW